MCAEIALNTRLRHMHCANFLIGKGIFVQKKNAFFFDWHTFTNISLFKIHRLYVVCRINRDCLLQVMVEIIALIDLEAVLAP